MKSHATRRALLGMAAALPALAIPAAAAAVPSANDIRPAFMRKKDRIHRLEAAHETFETEVVCPARARFKAIEEATPHTSIDFGENISGNRIIHTTAEDWHVRMARGAIERPYSLPEYQAAHVALAAAADAREAILTEARQASGLSHAYDRCNRFSEVICAAEWSFIETRVISVAELEVKLAFMIDRDAFSCDSAAGEILADVTALAAGVAA